MSEKFRSVLDLFRFRIQMQRETLIGRRVARGVWEIVSDAFLLQMRFDVRNIRWEVEDYVRACGRVRAQVWELSDE
jgi:hypothetical protein